MGIRKFSCPLELARWTAYHTQRRKAGVRGIGWEFTYESWCELWDSSGVWNSRGNTGNKLYCMTRLHDRGPYAPHNCVIDTLRNNVTQACGRPVVIGGVRYPSQAAAADALGIPRATFRKRLQRGYYTLRRE